MPLLGSAAVAMWWNVADQRLVEFHEWHSKEHLPERLGIPGFNRGSRWQHEGAGEFFVIYELATYETLVSERYLERLNDPTPWSRQMMPLHRDMVRSQCRVVASHGRGVATYMNTIRLSPGLEGSDGLDRYLRAALSPLPERAGITGSHLLRTDTPRAAMTAEQRIRGGDAVADWIVLVSGFDAGPLDALATDILGREKLFDAGAAEVTLGGPYRLVHAMTATDV